MEKFFACVTGVGEFAAEFADDGVLVFFADSAPEELHEYSIVHDNRRTLTDDIAAGDTIQLGSVAIPVLAAGKVASRNFRTMGHLVLKFNGLLVPEMEGDVTVPETPVPNISVGTEFRVLSG